MSKAAEASWSIPWYSIPLSIGGCVGPRAGLGRMEGTSLKVCVDGARVRGEKDGETSVRGWLGGEISGEAEVE